MSIANMLAYSGSSPIEMQILSFRGPEGPVGPKGENGADGVSPVVSVAPITGGNRLTIADANGVKTVDIMNGEGSGGSLSVDENGDATISGSTFAVDENGNAVI